MGAPPVDEREVRHIAELAAVDLDEEDIEQFAKEFATILDWFEALERVPAVEESKEVTNVLRPDEVQASLSQDAALSTAGETKGGYFKGPPVG